MKKELEEVLKNKFPGMLDDIGMIWCDDGWYGLIESACSCVSMHLKNRSIEGFRFTQIKEKFAGLRMYNEGGDEFTSGVITMAESMSYKTCEVTGNPGIRCRKGGYIRTLSKQSAEELGFEIISDRS